MFSAVDAGSTYLGVQQHAVVLAAYVVRSRKAVRRFLDLAFRPLRCSLSPRVSSLGTLA